MKNLRIIVVDDVSDSKDLLQIHLEQNKAKVAAFDSAKTALQAIEDFQPNLIISDVFMPEEDGYWLIEQINQRNSASKNYLPAIAITAAAKNEDRERLMAAGYDGYLAKPIMLEDLNTLIDKLVTRRLIQQSN